MACCAPSCSCGGCASCTSSARAPKSSRGVTPAVVPMGASVVVIVFARAPVPGQVKTRLVARIGEARAARLQAALTEQALRTARLARCGAVELHCTPGTRHAFFRSCGRKFDVRLD